MAVTGRQYGVGALQCKIFQLNASGSPAASSPTVYAGTRMYGFKSLDLTIPDAQRKTHVGDDGPIQVDTLPPTEGMSGNAIFAEENHTNIALVSNMNSFTVGAAKMYGLGTDKQGFETQVAMLVYQKTLDNTGARNYRTMILPKVIMQYKGAGFNENPAEHTFNVTPSYVTAGPWEKAFAVADEGFTRAQALVFQSLKPLGIASWLSDDYDTVFSFPVTEQANDFTTPAIAVFVDGTIQSSGITFAADAVTFDTAPLDDKRIVSLYEIAV